MRAVRIPLAAVCCVIAAVAISTGPANASVAGHYQHVYEAVDHANAGPYAGGVAGRNIADDGVLTKKGPRPATAAELRSGIAVMQRMLHPAPVSSYSPTAVPVTSTTTTVAPTTATTSAGGCPSYMAGEASSPTAVNSSSGAAGCFQVTPGTQAAMGAACSDVNSSSCVSAICASQGNAAWASSGATPCDYLGRP